MGLVHALIAEVLAHLVHSLEATHDEALQVELCGNAHIHVLIERIEMGDERTGRGTTGNVLQYRGVYLGISGIVEDTANGADDGGTLEEGVLDASVYDEVNVALTIAQFGVVEGVIYLAVGIGLHHRQWLQALAQHGHLHHVNTDFASLGAEYIALHANEVPQVQQLLEYNII